MKPEGSELGHELGYVLLLLQPVLIIQIRGSILASKLSIHEVESSIAAVNHLFKHYLLCTFHPQDLVAGDDYNACSYPEYFISVRHFFLTFTRAKRAKSLF